MVKLFGWFSSIDFKEDVEGGVSLAHEINDDCVMCGSCLQECPVDAIKEGDPKYIIDADLCTDCGSCAEICPVDAPKPKA